MTKEDQRRKPGKPMPECHTLSVGLHLYLSKHHTFSQVSPPSKTSHALHQAASRKTPCVYSQQNIPSYDSFQKSITWHKWVSNKTRNSLFEEVHRLYTNSMMFYKQDLSTYRGIPEGPGTKSPSIPSTPGYNHICTWWVPFPVIFTVQIPNKVQF